MKNSAFSKFICFAVFLMFFVTINSCNKDVEQAVPDMSARSYFPLNKGMSWTDSVLDIRIDVNSNVYDTAKYIQRTVIDSVASISKYSENAFCTGYIYDNNLKKWMLKNRFWYEKTKTQLIKHEDNYPTVELIFPLNLNTSWNRFAYTINSDTLLRSVVLKRDIPMNINSEFYDSVAEISQNIDSTLIYKYVEKSYFAKNVGLVEYEYFEIISDDPNFDYTLPIEQRVKTAHFITICRLKTD